MAKTRAQQNRAIRQEALREQLQAQGHVQHIVDILNEVNDLGNVLSASDVQRKKMVVDSKLKLINKYLPDLKATEITGEGGEAIEMDHFLQIDIVDPEDEDTGTEET